MAVVKIDLAINNFQWERTRFGDHEGSDWKRYGEIRHNEEYFLNNVPDFFDRI